MSITKVKKTRNKKDRGIFFLCPRDLTLSTLQKNILEYQISILNYSFFIHTETALDLKDALHKAKAFEMKHVCCISADKLINWQGHLISKIFAQENFPYNGDKDFFVFDLECKPVSPYKSVDQNTKPTRATGVLDSKKFTKYFKNEKDMFDWANKQNAKLQTYVTDKNLLPAIVKNTFEKPVLQDSSLVKYEITSIDVNYLGKLDIYKLLDQKHENPRVFDEKKLKFIKKLGKTKAVLPYIEGWTQQVINYLELLPSDVIIYTIDPNSVNLEIDTRIFQTDIFTGQLHDILNFISKADDCIYYIDVDDNFHSFKTCTFFSTQERIDQYQNFVDIIGKYSNKVFFGGVMPWGESNNLTVPHYGFWNDFPWNLKRF